MEPDKKTNFASPIVQFAPGARPGNFLSGAAADKKGVSEKTTAAEMNAKNKWDVSTRSANPQIATKEGVAGQNTSNVEWQVDERTRELREQMKISETSRIALMNMLEDMEDLRRREEEEKEKTLAIINNFADGLVLFDASDRCTLINPQIEAAFGVTREEGRNLIGKKINDFQLVNGFRPLADLIGPVITEVTRKELYISENEVYEVSVLEIQSAGRGKVGTLIIAHDVSREKSVERMKTEFVSIAAHQLRTPISAIKWTLRMILDGDLGPITEDQRDFLDKTYKSNERMINLINDLLNVTRIEEGRHLYNLALVSLEDVLDTLVNNYGQILERKKLTIDFAKPKVKLPQVKIDVEKIKLVIANLIENAIKYTPAGGNVAITIVNEGDNLKVTVKDSGIGIIKDQQSRIFTKYFRGSNALKTETEGTGLGLFITKNIVETHGGKIWFISEEGRGTSFFFSVPVAAPPKGPLQQAV